jgi:hypothetical protein
MLGKLVMNTNQVFFLLFMLVALGVPLLSLIRGWQVERQIDGLLAQGECTPDDLQVLAQALTVLNARSRVYTFSLKGAARIWFRGQRVWVISGTAGSVSPERYGEAGNGWRVSRSLYALAVSPDQVAWMEGNPETFARVSGDRSFPIFWVKLSALRANPPAQHQSGRVTSPEGV